MPPPFWGEAYSGQYALVSTETQLRQHILCVAASDLDRLPDPIQFRRVRADEAVLDSASACALVSIRTT